MNHSYIQGLVEKWLQTYKFINLLTNIVEKVFRMTLVDEGATFVPWRRSEVLHLWRSPGFKGNSLSTVWEIGVPAEEQALTLEILQTESLDYRFPKKRCCHTRCVLVSLAKQLQSSPFSAHAERWHHCNFQQAKQLSWFCLSALERSLSSEIVPLVPNQRNQQDVKTLQTPMSPSRQEQVLKLKWTMQAAKERDKWQNMKQELKLIQRKQPESVITENSFNVHCIPFTV